MCVIVCAHEYIYEVDFDSLCKREREKGRDGWRKGNEGGLWYLMLLRQAPYK